MRKRALSLIEMIVCLGLLSLLLSTLFYWYHSLTKQKEQFNALKGPIMEERYAHQRLQNILPKGEQPFFTDADHGLVFLFDNGLDLHPELSGKVLGRLYYDKSTQCLCLGIWPKPEKEQSLKTPCETLILLDDVSECIFEFYHPPDLFKKPVDPEQVGKPRPSEGWQGTWQVGYHALPALIKLTITHGKNTFVYCFDLPVTIIYPREKTV